MKKIIINLLIQLGLLLASIILASVLVVLYSKFLSAMPFLAVFIGIVIYVAFIERYFSN